MVYDSTRLGAIVQKPTAQTAICKQMFCIPLPSLIFTRRQLFGTIPKVSKHHTLPKRNIRETHFSVFGYQYRCFGRNQHCFGGSGHQQPGRRGQPVGVFRRRRLHWFDYFAADVQIYRQTIGRCGSHRHAAHRRRSLASEHCRSPSAAMEPENARSRHLPLPRTQCLCHGRIEKQLPDRRQHRFARPYDARRSGSRVGARNGARRQRPTWLR